LIRGVGGFELWSMATAMDAHITDPIDELLERMAAISARLAAAGDRRRYFHDTYARTTRAVRDEVAAGGFADSAWVARWDLAFAERYLVAFDAWERSGHTSGPWQFAFDSATRDEGGVTTPPLEHVLLGMNAHINLDLAPALLDVITSDDFDDEAIVALRRADHEHIDSVLARRVAAEDAELRALEAGRRSPVDRLLQPLNRIGTKRFLRESRAKVWHNARALDHARRVGDDAYAAQLVVLESLARAKVAQLGASRWVILEFARRGFGIELPG
jgi:hypothetical protein